MPDNKEVEKNTNYDTIVEKLNEQDKIIDDLRNELKEVKEFNRSLLKNRNVSTSNEKSEEDKAKELLEKYLHE